MKGHDRVERWLRDGGPPPRSDDLALYIIHRGHTDYPGDAEREIPPGVIPHHNWLARAAQQLALKVWRP